MRARQEAQEKSLQSYQKGLAAYQAGKFDEARKHLTEAVNQDERNAPAWMVLGAVEFKRENLFEAAHAFHRSARLEPGRYEPPFNLGMIYESAGRHENAIEAYTQALKLAPDQLEVMENLARCYIKTNQHLDKAKDLIDRALLIEQRPDWRQWLERQSQRLSRKKTEAIQ
jgi:Flp pilus assembly protein TadD